MERSYEVVVIGGGFFGTSVAVHLARAGRRVLLAEKEPSLLRRASYANQARIHNGYHYPRSLLTALRSRVNFERFVADYPEAVHDRFDKYYAVASGLSNVSAGQFLRFCDRIGAPHAAAPERITRLFDPDRVELVVKVREYAFDADQLARRMARELEEARVDLLLGVGATRIEGRGPRARVHLSSGDAVLTDWVFNCTYSALNGVLTASGLEPIALKHEVAELALIEPPAELREVGVTVMCGPFFSTMPFPAAGLHSFSHVRYTPHQHWHDLPPHGPIRDGHRHLQESRPRSQFTQMARDAARLLPAMASARYVRSLWEVKTVLPVSEVDDSRPILFKRQPALPGVVSIMGGKIDNIYDALRELDTLLDAPLRAHG